MSKYWAWGFWTPVEGDSAWSPSSSIMFLEDHDFLQSSLSDMAKADPFFGRLMELHLIRSVAVRTSAWIQRDNLVVDAHWFHGRSPTWRKSHWIRTVLQQAWHHLVSEQQNSTSYMQNQWPETYKNRLEDLSATPAENQGLAQLAWRYCDDG